MRSGLFLLLLLPLIGWAMEDQLLPAKAAEVPFWTAPEGEGYFAIIEGKDRRLYIGTHANGLNSWLVQFNPATGEMKAVVDAAKAIGSNATGFASQSKIHTRNNIGASGKIYFATKQGYPATGESRLAYPGGYPMRYDPATGETDIFPIPVPHHGIISIIPDEARGVFYVSTCNDARPVESTHFLVYDLKEERYTDLGDLAHMYAFVVVDWKGRAYHPIRGGEIARYDRDRKLLERLPQTIDGAAPSPESHLADANSHPINWDISTDRKTMYAVPMSANALYAYDLTAEGKALPGRTIGPLLDTDSKTDCRALCVGPTGIVWAAVTVPTKKLGRVGHLVRFDPKRDKAPVDLGIITVSNPNFTEFTNPDGKTKPYYSGFAKLDTGELIPRRVLLGICETANGDVHIQALQPFTILTIPKALATR